MASKIYFVFTVAVLYVQCISKHLSNAECPPHKPYHTDAGCVYRCPKDFHINGSSCVVTCGDWFTNKNRECQRECPDSYFVKEVVGAIGWDSYLEKQCVASCDSTEFIFNGTCVEACPIESMYIVNKTCVHSCPDGFSFLNNFTKSDLLYHECFESCPVYQEDNYCTNSCSEGRLQFNYVCVETCPKSQQYFYANQCLKHCPSWWPFDANKTCVSKCPLLLPFIHNSSCVAKCPKEFPYSDMRTDGSELCVDVCGQKSEHGFLSNNTCVSKCPNFTYNRTCINKCPTDFPIANNVTIGKNCEYDSECTKILQYAECVEECPSEKILLPQKNACVESCPNDMVLLNHTCVHSCDEKVPYSKEITVNVTSWSYERLNRYIYGDSTMRWKKISKTEIIAQCVNDCSDDHLKLNYTCAQRCPGLNDMPADLENPWNVTSQYFRYGRSCVKKCPEDHVFVARSYVKKRKEPCRSWNCDETIWYLECVAECPNNTYMYRNMCLNFCPDNLFFLGKTCIVSCPQKQHLQLAHEVNIVVTDKQFGLERTTKRSFFECVSNCGEKLVYNNSCVDKCPVNEPYLSSGICHNNTCGTKYELKSSKGIECWTECPEGTVRSASKCTPKCPVNEPYLSGNICHNNTCGTMYELKSSKGIECWTECPGGTMLRANKCTTKCPDELKYDFNSICVKQCPSSKPFGVDINKDTFSLYDKKSEFKCLSKCEGDKLYKQDEGACIYPYECDDPYFVFAGQCLKRCPNGYKWFLSCFHWIAALICTLIMAALTLIYCVCCLRLFKETYNFITICRQYTKHCRGEDRAENLLQLWNEEEPNNPGETEYTSLNIVDTVVIQTFNDRYINNAFETDINI